MPVSLVRCHVLGYWGNVVDSMHVRMEMELASLGDPRRSGTRSVVLDVISLYISTGHRDTGVSLCIVCGVSQLSKCSSNTVF